MGIGIKPCCCGGCTSCTSAVAGKTATIVFSGIANDRCNFCTSANGVTFMASWNSAQSINPAIQCTWTYLGSTNVCSAAAFGAQLTIGYNSSTNTTTLSAYLLYGSLGGGAAAVLYQGSNSYTGRLDCNSVSGISVALSLQFATCLGTVTAVVSLI